MKVLGEKKKGIEYIYLFVLFLSTLLIFIGIKQVKVVSGFIFLIAGIVCLIFGIYMIIDIIKYPKDIIVFNELDNTLILNNKIVISISSIEDVTFINSRNKSIVWKWGTVVIKIKGQTLKCKYVKDCEKVAKLLMKLMYKKEL